MNKWIFSAHTEKGIRKKNEDNFYIAVNKDNQLLMVVCDGVGSYSNSDLASELVVTIFKHYFDKYDNINECGGFKKFYNTCIKHCIFEIDKISQKKLTNDEKIGTTVNVAFVNKNNVECANIGDTHTYHFINEKKQLQQISYDHNLFNYIKESYRKKKIKHPNNINELEDEEKMLLNQHRDNLASLTACLETGFNVNENTSSYNSFELEKDDQIIICTDGVYNWIKAMDVIKLINSNNYSECSKTICKISLNNQSTDNVTFLCAKYQNE